MVFTKYYVINLLYSDCQEHADIWRLQIKGNTNLHTMTGQKKLHRGYLLNVGVR